MKRFRDASLSTKFLFPLLSVTFLILATGGLFLQNQVRSALQGQTDLASQGFREEQRMAAEAQKQGLETKADAIGQLMVKAAPDFIAAFDLLTLASLEEVAETDVETEYAIFLRPDGMPMTRTALPETREDIFQKRYAVDYEGENLGSVVIGISRAAIDSRVARSQQRLDHLLEEVGSAGGKAVNDLLSILAITYVAVLGVIILVVSALFRRMVVKPLHRISTVLEDMGQGRLDARLQMERGDEIGRIAGSMDEMAEKLGLTVRRIDTSSAELVNASSRIGEVSLRVGESGSLQLSGANDAHSAVQGINHSVEQVGERMGSLAEMAGESTSSILEMTASIEDVAEHADEVARSAEEVGASISEIVTSIRQVAESTSVLKETSDSTASSVAQMDAAVGQVETSAKETARITETVRQDAELGKTSVEAVISGMGQIRTASRTASEAIAALSEKAQNIGNILSVISEVTDQTNLLALNAAIIAAQAGEQGKGFSVVADEIRELADRTGTSTGEIAAMIKGVQQETARAVQAIHQAEQNVSEGESLSRTSGEALKKIVDGIRDVDQRMDQVARATLEQAQGARMIRDAIEKVSEMVDQTAGATREQSRAAEMIQAAVERMREMAGQVRSSTREQSGGSKQLAQTMETINDMVQEINRACEEQQHESGQILKAVEAIRSSSEANMESTRVMQEAVDSQNRQIVVLKEEVSYFRLAQTEKAS